MSDSPNPLEALRTLLRFDTTNPPGNEEPAIAQVGEWLTAAGVAFTVLRSDGRPNLVARIAGDGTGGGPLLLSGHVDVVPVERAMWTQDPFAAAVVDGYLYGRGTIDMKYMVVHCITAFLDVARSGKVPSRDLILAVVSDEEEGCEHGSRFLVEQHADDVRADYMLGEFGGFSLDVKGKRYYPIQVAEKGACQFRLTAHGDPGHGSVPHNNNAVVKLAQAIAKLGTTRLPAHLHPTVSVFLKEMARHQKAPDKWVLPLLKNPALAGPILKRVIPDKSIAASMAANLSNTVSPTGLSAGAKLNVIPGKASALLDGRLIPGETQESFLAEIREVIGEGFDIEVLTSFEGRANTAVMGDPLFEAICDNVRKHDASGIPLPYMLTGFTDAQNFGKLGAQCFGYAPVQFPAEDEVKFNTLVHGHDERIHVAGFEWGNRAFRELVTGFLGVG
ncbi:MAG: acetylornithine deacetylase/succinyl-diaminopimelate desuccinylase-like protein [Bradymonadia bacterium]|jgi:acetylornithine deacetylase/succinyl-diaminopimelate desuccinylase-like protein